LRPIFNLNTRHAFLGTSYANNRYGNWNGWVECDVMMEIMVLILPKNWGNKFMGGTIYVLAGNVQLASSDNVLHHTYTNIPGMMKILMGE
jgi:hypothetical protein